MRVARLLRDPVVQGSIRNEREASALILATETGAPEQLEQLLLQLDPDAFAQGRWLLLRDYAGGVRGRSVLFVFHHDVPTPSMVLKIRDTRAEGPALAREERVLSLLEQTLPGDLRRLVPRVLGYFEEAGREVLAISGLPGQPLDLAMQRSVLPLHAHQASLWSAGRWLGTLHGLTRSDSDDGESIVHGDFWPRNILCEAPGEISGVIDWEHGAISGDPRDDLFTLPLQYVMNAPAWSGRQGIAKFVDGFVRETAVSRIVAHYFDEYCSAAGVHRSSIPRALDAFISESLVHARETKPQWKAEYPWSQMQSQLAQAKRSVLSG
ncbi:MAG TPA: phosphotransferase [Thermoanaerobaculia bacterium]|nr:phosphotransferase [Thermoanaerobaculia bacterium]